MANNLTVTYKGNTIHSASASGSATLKTGGTWCEGDIGLSYTFDAAKATLAVAVTNGTATSVTATKSGVSVSLTYSGGVWSAELPSFGTWIVSATDGTRSQTDTVNASVAGLYTLTLRLQDIPNAYTQLEWVEASNATTYNQRIFTDYYPIYTNRVRCALQMPYGYSIPTDTQALIRINDGTGCYWYFRLRYNNGNHHVRYAYGTTAGSNTNFSPPTTNKMTVDFRGKNITVNDVSRVNSGSNITTNTKWNLHLWFTGWNDTDVIVRWYYFEVYNADDTELVVNLIPAKRNSDGTVGMYDTIANAFRTPTVGTLTAGPAV